jgi:hypothetical protein
MSQERDIIMPRADRIPTKQHLKLKVGLDFIALVVTDPVCLRSMMESEDQKPYIKSQPAGVLRHWRHGLPLPEGWINSIFTLIEEATTDRLENADSRWTIVRDISFTDTSVLPRNIAFLLQERCLGKIDDGMWDLEVNQGDNASSYALPLGFAPAFALRPLLELSTSKLQTSVTKIRDACAAYVHPHHNTCVVQILLAGDGELDPAAEVYSLKRIAALLWMSEDLWFSLCHPSRANSPSCPRLVSHSRLGKKTDESLAAEVRVLE